MEGGPEAGGIRAKAWKSEFVGLRWAWLDPRIFKKSASRIRLRQGFDATGGQSSRKRKKFEPPDVGCYESRGCLRTTSRRDRRAETGPNQGKSNQIKPLFSNEHAGEPPALQPTITGDIPRKTSRFFEE
jgi:hypothetical protein